MAWQHGPANEASIYLFYKAYINNNESEDKVIEK